MPKEIKYYVPAVGDKVIFADKREGTITSLSRHCRNCDEWADVLLKDGKYPDDYECPNLDELHWDEAAKAWRCHMNPEDERTELCEV